jgi:hypothetical protein
VPFKILAAAYNELVKLTVQRNELGISEESILTLRDIAASWAVLGVLSVMS